MTCITQEDIQSTLVDMKEFYNELKSMYSSHGMNLEDNLGRRNILMSMVQEEFLARTLNKRYDSVVADGAPGKADIVIEDIDKEVECKLTTITKSGAISLQSDHDTLKQKGSLDYIYFIASPDFNDFAVIYFEDLTVDDFRPVANGSRGKVAMYKHKGMQKANLLWGAAKIKNVGELLKINGLFEEEAERFRNNMKSLTEKKCITLRKIGSKKHESGRVMSDRDLSTANADLNKLMSRQNREKTRHSKKITKLMDRKSYWTSQPGKYTFVLETV